mgnify:CR=1 FL=1
MIDGQDPSMQPGGMDPGKYHGEFTMSSAHDLARDAAEFKDGPVEDYFAVLSGAASAQGYPDMAAAIDQVSKTSMGSLLRGQYEPIGTSFRNGVPTSTEPAEQWARNYVASSLGFALADLYALQHSQKTDQGGETIADLQVGGALDKELFVVFARILASEPEKLDSTAPTPDQVTDKDKMGVTPEDEAKGIVTLDGQPDKIVRFQKVTVDSTVPGFNFEMWRHNGRGFIRGNETDKHKLYLVRK